MLFKQFTYSSINLILSLILLKLRFVRFKGSFIDVMILLKKIDPSVWFLIFNKKKNKNELKDICLSLMPVMKVLHEKFTIVCIEERCDLGFCF